MHWYIIHVHIHIIQGSRTYINTTLDIPYSFNFQAHIMVIAYVTVHHQKQISLYGLKLHSCSFTETHAVPIFWIRSPGMLLQTNVFKGIRRYMRLGTCLGEDDIQVNWNTANTSALPPPKSSFLSITLMWCDLFFTVSACFQIRQEPAKPTEFVCLTAHTVGKMSLLGMNSAIPRTVAHPDSNKYVVAL